MMSRESSENSGAPVAIPFFFVRSWFLTGARIKGMGTFLDRTPGDPNDADAIEPNDRAQATLLLGISQEAGAKRSFRAMKRLKDVLATMPGSGEGP
jgi:hypothetical protein